MLNFLNDTATFGTTGPLERKKRKREGQTVTDMRKDMTLRAEETIKALDAYQGGVLRAPMARSIRNGLCVKIGYGKRNTGFFDGPKEERVAIIPDRNFRRNESSIAIAYLKKVIAAINAGEFDGLLGQTLSEIKARFEKEDDEDKSQPQADESPKKVEQLKTRERT